MSLEDARAALLRDLENPAYDGLVDECVEHRRWWVEQWRDGAQFLVCLVAQDVQEAVQAQEPRWPLCGEHGDHALVVEPDLGTDPFWVCERSVLPVAPVGSLRQLGP